MENPFTRLRKSKGLTQHAISIRAGCSRHLVIRTEQACYTDPPPVMLKYFAGAFLDGDVSQLNSEYHQYQKESRAKTGRLFGDDLRAGVIDSESAIKILDGELHPLTYLRGDLNITEVAKRLCMSQSTLYRFENKPQLQQTVPDELKVALKDCGYEDYEIDDLEHFYSKYRALRKGVKHNVRSLSGFGRQHA